MLAYIAGPYRAPTADEIAEHVARACYVARHAITCGRLAIVPHAYGQPVFGGDDDLALAWCEAMARHVGSCYGEIWCISRDDGSLSPGTRLELRAYLRGAGDAGRGCALPWARWREIATAGCRPPIAPISLALLEEKQGST